MSLEPEFLAMRQIDRAFSKFDSSQDKERLVAWTISKYGPQPVAESAPVAG